MDSHGGLLYAQVSASVFCQCKTTTLNLPGTGLVAQLSYQFEYLAKTRSPDGMSPGCQTSGGVYEMRTSEAGCV